MRRLTNERIASALSVIERRCVRDALRRFNAAIDQIEGQALIASVRRDRGALERLRWNVALNECFLATWEAGFALGQQHARRHALENVDPRFKSLITKAPAPGVRQILQLTDDSLTNAGIVADINTRTLQISGNFEEDALSKVRNTLLDATGSQNRVVPSRASVERMIREALGGISPARAQNIARTELTNAYAAGRRHTIEQSELVTHARFVAIQDDRITDICSTRAGLVVEVGSPEYLSNQPALHYQCRSFWRPLLPSVSRRDRRVVDDPDNSPANRVLVALQGSFGQVEVLTQATPVAAVTEIVPTSSRPHPSISGEGVNIPSADRRVLTQGDKYFPGDLEVLALPDRPADFVNVISNIEGDADHEISTIITRLRPAEGTDLARIRDRVREGGFANSEIYSYNFTVDGDFAAAAVPHSRADRASITRMIAHDFRRVMDELPEGAILENTPFSDADFAMRVNRYNRQGFGPLHQVLGAESQFAMKLDGQLHPLQFSDVLGRENLERANRIFEQQTGVSQRAFVSLVDDGLLAPASIPDPPAVPKLHPDIDGDGVSIPTIDSRVTSNPDRFEQGRISFERSDDFVQPTELRLESVVNGDERHTITSILELDTFIPEEVDASSMIADRVASLNSDAPRAYIYSFKVNGSFTAGENVSRRDRASIARLIAHDYSRVMQELPEGTVLLNIPFDDEDWAMRVNRYARSGFGPLHGDGVQYAVYQEGQLHPLNFASTVGQDDLERNNVIFERITGVSQRAFTSQGASPEILEEVRQLFEE